MIFKIICICTSSILALRFGLKFFQNNENRFMSLISTLFWMVTSFILVFSQQIKIILMEILSIKELENATDVFIHGAILIYAYLFIRIVNKLFEMDKNIKSLSREIALLYQMVRNNKKT